MIFDHLFRDQTTVKVDRLQGDFSCDINFIIRISFPKVIDLIPQNLFGEQIVGEQIVKDFVILGQFCAFGRF